MLRPGEGLKEALTAATASADPRTTHVLRYEREPVPCFGSGSEALSRSASSRHSLVGRAGSTQRAKSASEAANSDARERATVRRRSLSIAPTYRASSRRRARGVRVSGIFGVVVVVMFLGSCGERRRLATVATRAPPSSSGRGYMTSKNPGLRERTTHTPFHEFSKKSSYYNGLRLSAGWAPPAS